MVDVDRTEAPLRRNVGIAVATLITSGGTLVCCVLPAVMVGLGAGAALAGLVTAVPQLIWLSEHKGLVFGTALVMLAVSGRLLWRARTFACPADLGLAQSCIRLRRWSWIVWSTALLCTTVGIAFAFVLPKLS